MYLINKELNLKVNDVLNAIESVETAHNGEDQDLIKEAYKSDILYSLGFLSRPLDSGTETFESLKDQIYNIN